MYKFSFEKLTVWQKSRELVKEIYKATKLYPETERFGLISQMQRASVSVMSNIAEGSTRFGNKSQANFYQIAYSSLMEVVSEVITAKDLDYINEKEYFELREKINKLSNKLNSLYNLIKGVN